MSRIMQPIVQELEQEAHATRNLLERVPEDQLDWRPHEKSMTLGQLALHVAQIPGGMAQMLDGESITQEEAGYRQNPSPSSAAELVPAHDESLKTALALYGAYDEAKAVSHFRFVNEEKELINAPRASLVRSLGMNHWYHHRAQLGVYLRMLGVDLPSTYGPTADEDPFA